MVSVVPSRTACFTSCLDNENHVQHEGPSTREIKINAQMRKPHNSCMFGNNYGI